MKGLDEFTVLKEAAPFLSNELGIEVRVYKSGQEGIHDPGKKSPGALPFKPAFYLE